jgi:hypothetical protein
MGWKCDSNNRVPALQVQNPTNPPKKKSLHLLVCLLNCNLYKHMAWHLWLTPVILATQEAEIRRITVQSQAGQIVHETLPRKSPHKKGLVEWLKV